MTTDDFLAEIDRNRIRADAFSLNGPGNEVYALVADGTRWKTFYSERGLETGPRYFETQSAALEALLEALLTDPTAHR